jgi:hypothetical protein
MMSRTDVHEGIISIRRKLLKPGNYANNKLPYKKVTRCFKNMQECLMGLWSFLGDLRIGALVHI